MQNSFPRNSKCKTPHGISTPFVCSHHFVLGFSLDLNQDMSTSYVVRCLLFEPPLGVLVSSR